MYFVLQYLIFIASYLFLNRSRKDLAEHIRKILCWRSGKACYRYLKAIGPVLGNIACIYRVHANCFLSKSVEILIILLWGSFLHIVQAFDPNSTQKLKSWSRHLNIFYRFGNTIGHCQITSASIFLKTSHGVLLYWLHIVKLRFHLAIHTNYTHSHFHINSCAACLALIERIKASPKWLLKLAMTAPVQI